MKLVTIRSYQCSKFDCNNYLKAGTNEGTTSEVTTNLPAGSTGQSSTDDQTPTNQSIYIGLGVAFAVVAVTAVAIGIALCIQRNKKRYVCQTDLCTVVISSSISKLTGYISFGIKTHKLHTSVQDSKFVIVNS